MDIQTHNDIFNKPNGKTSQTFYFTKPYEAKHAIGIKHRKRMEFESREGISSVDSLCDYYSNGQPPNYYGRFIISGKKNAVDNLMIEIKEWLEKCQGNYQNFIYTGYRNYSNNYKSEAQNRLPKEVIDKKMNLLKQYQYYLKESDIYESIEKLEDCFGWRWKYDEKSGQMEHRLKQKHLDFLRAICDGNIQILEYLENRVKIPNDTVVLNNNSITYMRKWPGQQIPNCREIDFSLLH